MLNKQLQTLLQGALGCQDVNGLKFAYALQKNIRLMKQEIQHLFDILEPSEEYKKYDKEREELAKQFSEKDKDGNPVIENERYKIKGKKKFEAELKNLQKKYEKALNEQTDKESLFNEALEKECTVKFHQIIEKDLPSDMSLRQLEIVSSFMYDKNDPEEVEKKRENRK